MQFSVDKAPSSDFHRRHQALREKFIAGIPKRLLDIETASCATVRAQLLHQLIGAALSFKAEALGHLARANEIALVEDFKTNWPACLALLRAELRRLESEVA
jgi:HPt (histidine-containing phosphotransfer) domain-containing protein